METSHIEWLFEDGQVTREDILEIADSFQVSFPEDYVRCVLEHHGGSPDPGSFDFLESDGGAGFGSLLTYIPSDDNYILDIFGLIEDRLPPHTIPITITASGNHLCLHYHEGPGNPPMIVFWHHEEAISADDLTREQLESKPLEQWQQDRLIPVSHTLTQLLDKLYE